ncbi:MAG TPA: Ppx/GppA family phosphatase, partial [Kiloniellales bacterium]|nr:Ppx/GppA family phosphatase [Kiloniellales bacterium]
LLDPAVPNALVFDIGGGSTELGWMQLPEDGGFFGDGAAPELAGWCSLPIGVVTLAERHGGRRVTAAAYRAMVEEVEAAVAPFEAEHRLAERVAAGRLQMLGTSGTVTTLAGIEQDLPRYQRTRVDGRYLDFATVAAISRRVAGMSYDERVAHPCIGRERADLVIAGCAILEAFCRLWPVGRLRVADRGLREGMLFLMMHGPAACAPRRPAGSTTPPATPTSGVPRAGGLQPV